MIISLDTGSSIPIYVQLRNQIVTGIGRGELKEGERLPTVRQLAEDAGVNTMTVNKTYQLLKMEGFITIDRRRGATVSPVRQWDEKYREKLEAELELLSAEARMKGMEQAEFLTLCEQIFSGMRDSKQQAPGET
ncbi:MAG: GntR family transcriptional regulator [Acetatifactor sp.]|nr:GntR family transcriptional regulator [Acetatifactor sp.]